MAKGAERLYYSIQRYKFESNSQQAPIRVQTEGRCITRYKDTNLKAIHNRLLRRVCFQRLYYSIQRYKFESNSQQLAIAGGSSLRCITRYKDTNLKAIHN